MIKKILYIAISMLIFTACSSDKNPPVNPTNDALDKFLGNTEIGAYSNGYASLVYSELLHQKAVNPTEQSFRIQNDAQTTYFHAKVTGSIATGATVAVDILSRNTTISGQTLSMTVEKVESGQTWLWHEDSKVGIILPF